MTSTPVPGLGGVQSQPFKPKRNTPDSNTTTIPGFSSPVSSEPAGIRPGFGEGGFSKPAGSKSIQEVLADIEAGRDLGKDLIGNLDRLDPSRAQEIADIIAQRQAIAGTAGQRSSDVEDIIARRRAALEGFSAPELNVLESRRLEDIGRAEETALRRLKGVQSEQNLRGGLAGAQQSSLLQEGARQRAALGQELFLGNIAERQRALGEFEQTVGGAESGEFQRRQEALGALEGSTGSALGREREAELFNIGQQQKEKFAELASGFGVASLGAGERGLASQGAIAAAESAALNNQANSVGKK